MSILYSFARFKTLAGIVHWSIGREYSVVEFKYLILPITSMTSCFGIFISTHNGGVVVASSNVQPRRILFLTVSSLISSSSMSFCLSLVMILLISFISLFSFYHCSRYYPLLLLMSLQLF